MPLRQNLKDTFAPAVLAASLFFLPAAVNAVPACSTSTSTTSTVDKGLTLVANCPTKERPFYYARFDQDTKINHASADVITTTGLNGDKIVVLNFIDERDPYSPIQTDIVKKSITALKPRSKAKELMLIDVVAVDEQGDDVYLATYGAYYKSNTLGPKDTKLDELVLPYGVVIGEAMNENQTYGMRFDFAISHGVISDRDLQESARGIFGRLYVTIKGFNQQLARQNDLDSRK